MKEFFTNKKNRLLLCIALLVIVVCGLVVSLLGNVSHEMDKAVYPDSTLTESPVAFDKEVKYTEMLPLRVACPTLEYSVWLPSDVYEDNDCLVASYEGIKVVVAESPQSIETVATSVFPHQLNRPILGRKDKVDTYSNNTGYFYEYPASYYTCTVQSQISTRTVTTYSLTYGLHLSDDVTLYIYVSSESKDLLNGQKELLDKIAFSVRKVDLEQEEDLAGHVNVTEENMTPEGNNNSGLMKVEDYVEENTYLDENVLRIYLEKEMSEDVTQGVFIFGWMNILSHPVEVNVIAPDGRELHRIDEYSSEGHYVYNIGECASGTYIVEGYTIEQLTGVTMYIYEEEFYKSEYLHEGIYE